MTHAFTPPSGQPTLGDADLRAIAAILHEHAGIVIAPGKGSMVQSRLAKRLRALGLNDYGSYISLLTSDAGQAERKEMISALTTNVTHFFRENHHFETLRNSALPPLLARARAGGRVRIWSAGSSNGQEAYSIAMVLAEMASDFARLDIRILATDIDPVMIACGRAGTYDSAAVEAVPEALRRKYFEPTSDGQRVIQPVRDCVSFRELNLHDPWPMKGRFDIIFCRNVVIYFDPEAQQRLWHRLEATLNPGGWLFVGHSERVALDGASAFKTAGITTYRLPDAGQTDGGTQWH
jgi:chemotaxis protein methyltransferase CheR